MALFTAQSEFNAGEVIISLLYDDETFEVISVNWSTLNNKSAILITDDRSIDLTPGQDKSMSFARNRRPKINTICNFGIV